MILPETAVFTAAILLILQMVLMLSVGMHRFSVKVGVGYGEDADLHRKIRRHGNLSENAGIFLIALALAEMAGAPALWVQVLALVFVAARLSHALAFASKRGSHSPEGSVTFPMLRAFGAFATAGAGFGLGALLLASQI